MGISLESMNKVFEDLSTTVFENEEGFFYVSYKKGVVLDLVAVHQSLSFFEQCSKSNFFPVLIDLSNVLSIRPELKKKILAGEWLSMFSRVAFLHVSKPNFYLINFLLRYFMGSSPPPNVKAFESQRKAEAWIREGLYERVDGDFLMPETKIYKGDHCRTFQRYDGILFSEALPGFCGLESAKEQLQLIRKFFAKKKQRLPFLLDIRKVKSKMTFGARQIYFSPEFRKYSGNIAILVHSSFSKALIHCLIKNRPDERFFKVFANKKEALIWLKQSYASCYLESSCKHTNFCNHSLNPHYQAYERELGEDGILYYRFEKDCTVAEQDVENMLEESLHESMGEKINALLDLRSVAFVSRKARKMFKSSFANVLFRRLAILCPNHFELFLWKIILLFSKKYYNISLFLSKQNAIRWLLELKKDEKYPVCEMNFSLKIKELLTVIAAFTRRDFSQKLNVSKSKNPFNQLAHGINFLGEELEEQDKEIKEKQSQLIQAEKLASLGELSSSLGHELNNPLCIAMGFSDILDRKAQDPKTSQQDLREYVRSISDSLTRMHKIIKHMKEYSRKPNEKFEILSINEIIDKSLILISEQLKLSSIKVHTHLCEISPKILGDGNRLEQVFLNIISNAKDAFADRPIYEEKFITITSSTENDSVSIYFEDNGTGIPSNIQSRIFDPFFTSKDVGKGTGLGLSISHEIIKEHQGEISCQSRLGEGSIFIVKIPIYKEERLSYENG